MYADRSAGGRALAQVLAEHELVRRAREDGRPTVVLGIPRGGLPVGAEVATALGAELDVAVVRKLRTPWQRELGFGAVGPDGVPLVDEAMVQRLGLDEDTLQTEVTDRAEEVRRRLAEFRQVRPAATVRDALVIVVDDGVATGGTARTACEWARQAGAAAVVLAAPVGPPGVEERLGDAADAVVVPLRPAFFAAVGQGYADFRQLDDAEALEALRAVAGQARSRGDD